MRPLIVQAEHRPLLGSALLGIVAVEASLLVGSALMAQALQLRGSFILKGQLVFLSGVLLLLHTIARHHPFESLGSGNCVTAIRGALIACLAGLIGEHFGTQTASWAAIIALVVTILDGVDGRLARHTGMTSAFGARFDMECDAVFVAVLSVLAWQSGKVGPWVLLSGLMRYLYAGLARVLPLLRRPVPSTLRGKSIAVLQMLALILVLWPASPEHLSTAVAAAALLTLLVSFSLDVVWLVRSAPAVT